MTQNEAGAILAKTKSKKQASDIPGEVIHAAAVELGSAGGLIGGPARADALSDQRRSEIASYAASVRWSGRRAK